MADVLTKEQRKKNMQHIRANDTKIEVRLRKALWNKGYRYRKNYKELPGKPDIVLPKYKTVIFVNGCFWHKHDCPRFVWPSSNTDYWIPKIQRNVERDISNYAELSKLGWHVIVVWECELKKKVLEDTMNRIENEILKGTDN